MNTDKKGEEIRRESDNSMCYSMCILV